MERAYNFLIDCHRVFYLATCENGEPYVRPFGAVIYRDGRLIFCTGRDKRVYRQMLSNPYISICACKSGVQWMRISGKAAFFDDELALSEMLNLEERLQRKYGPDGRGLALFAITDGRAIFSERGRSDEIIDF